MPKHEGQAAVASRALQYRQRVASVSAAAPHIGQLRVSACIVCFGRLSFSLIEEEARGVEGLMTTRFRAVFN
jgi:hypothetical protein